MEKIMVIDDDPTSSAVCKALFSSTYEVVLMKSGLQALGYIKSYSLPNLILLDSNLPGLSGIQILEQLKDELATQSIPVIFLSENPDINLATECYAKGAVDFIVKPIIPILISKKVEYILSHEHLIKENQALKERVQVLEVLRKRPY